MNHPDRSYNAYDIAAQVGATVDDLVYLLRRSGYNIKKTRNLQINHDQLRIIRTEYEQARVKPTGSSKIDKEGKGSKIADLGYVFSGEVVSGSKFANSETLKNRIDEHLNKATKNLNLSGLGLNGVPERLSKLTSLEELNLSANQIEHLSNLPPNLKRLWIDDNRLVSLSGIPKNLVALSAKQNSLAAIEFLPETLVELNLANNQITKCCSLPTKLVNVNFAGNKLRTLSWEGELTVLRLCSNQITTLASLSSLERVSELYLFGNQIDEIPESIIGMSPEFDCASSIRNWLIELERKSERNTHVKLIILGNSNVGKTSIIRALRGWNYRDDMGSTHGIEINSFTINDPDALVNLQIWDLGGQEIYYGTHRAFMMSQAVQVVVFDSETEALSVSPDRLTETEFVRNIKLPFYVNRVRELSPQSELVIVENKVDEKRQLSDYAKEYAFERYVPFSAKNSRGIRDLRSNIHEAALDLKVYGQYVPYYWERVRRFFVANNENDAQERLRIINRNTFIQIARREKVLENGIEDLLYYLHNTGALYYRPELGENIIVDQVWALKAIYKVFDRDSSFYRELRHTYFGKCTVRTLFEDFDKTDTIYAIEEKWVFIKYMESCGLCFPVKAAMQRDERLDTFYVFPEFLPTERPDFVQLWCLKDTRRKVIRKRFRFLPYYPLHKFISKMGPRTKHSFLWRSGVLVCMDNRRFDGFLVEADFNDHTIQITLDADLAEWEHAIIEQLQIDGEIEGEEWELICGEEPQNIAATVPKTASDLLNIRNTVQDKENEGFLPNSKRLVISYAKEDIAECRLLAKYLESNRIDFWYDEEMSNRAGWDKEIQGQFLRADGYIILLSADYMNIRKTYIQSKELPLIHKRVQEDGKFCVVLTVGHFTLNHMIHPLICDLPCYKKGSVLPSVLDKDKSSFFMDQFIRDEILRKF